MPQTSALNGEALVVSKRPTSVYICVLCFALCVITVAAPLRAYGPNLLANSAFNFSVAGWSENPGTCAPEWTLRDANGSINSGSMRLPCGTSTGQCVPVEGGKSYVVATTAWIPSGSPEDSYAFAAAFWYDNSTCSGNAGGDGPFFPPEHGRWVDQAKTVVAPDSARSAKFQLWSTPGVYFDNAFFGTGTCAPNSTQLCLNEGRFQVQATWTKPDRTSGPGMAIPFAADSGSFWFFGPTNIELDIKVLNACIPSLGNRYWVFAAGLTNVEVVVTVTDTKTGAVRTYTNPQGTPFQPITDTNAFATCP